MNKKVPRIFKAIYDYKGDGYSDLSFNEGDILTQISHENDFWFFGSLNEKVGLVPFELVVELKPDLMITKYQKQIKEIKAQLNTMTDLIQECNKSITVITKEMNSTQIEIHNLQNENKKLKETGSLQLKKNLNSCCVICLENTRSQVIVPCGHSCLCEECAKYFKRKRVCPICRKKITKILTINPYYYKDFFNRIKN
ncbi:hypothetical protein M0812_01157 [Anaeramoeba flamelloides]|uniref:RING-type domain-containing protein n=1 Tax=Anaeramoeba flamelloides TaxID=1746091 RepID=A0AAV8A9J8_9EUKA|nr:hypothetical protein M0812_01157 [Anaeramoeba flamelloides]